MSFALLLALACSSSEPVAPVGPQVDRKTILVYTNNLDGETEPCG